LGGLEGLRVLVVGAGEAGELAAHGLSHIADIGLGFLAQGRDGVDQRDPLCQKSIGNQSQYGIERPGPTIPSFKSSLTRMALT